MHIQVSPLLQNDWSKTGKTELSLNLALSILPNYSARNYVQSKKYLSGLGYRVALIYMWHSNYLGARKKINWSSIRARAELI